MSIAREVRCTVCQKEGADVLACDSRENCKLEALPPKYKHGESVFVRHLREIYQVESIDWSRGALGAHRYHLSRVKDNRGALGSERKEFTTAYAADLSSVPAAAPAPELSLAPDPQPAAAVQDAAQPGPATGAAADAEHGAADAISDPDAGYSPSYGVTRGDGPVSKEMDHTDDPEERIAREIGLDGRLCAKRQVRYAPSVSMPYRQLKQIIYSGSFPEMEGRLNSDLDGVTPVGVVVTKESNGAAVWVILCDGDQIKNARQEVFYPTENEPSEVRAENAAIEYGVLLALRKIPITTNDLEIVLLGLS